VNAEKAKGKMTVADAGRLEGEKTAKTHGEKFYREIGRKGSRKVRNLIAEGKKHENE
jgi:general stress protein YciG